MKTTLLFLLITLNVSAQFLSYSKSSVISIIEGKVAYTTGTNSDGIAFISAPNISGCACLYLFDKNNICRKEIITALSDTAVIDLIMDLDEKHYFQINNYSWHEESYGLVEVNRNKNKFTFAYE